jgi:drug/metabolite transporter (DMT)-like permease
MHLRHVWQLLLLSLVWGGAYLFMRASVPAFGPAPMIFLRMALGSALVLLPLALRRHGPGPLREHWRELTIFGIAFTAVPFLGLGYAAKSISAGMLAILQSAAPLFSAVVAHYWLRDRITPSRAAGLVIGFAGVALLVWDKASVRGDEGVAILVTLLVTALWGVSSNYARRRLQALDPIVVATGSIGVAALALAPVAWATWPVAPPSARAWAEVVFLGVAGSGFGFLLYFALIAQVGPVRTVSVTFLSPVVAMVAAVFYLDEAVTPRMAVGCAVIVAGTALTLGLLPGARGRNAARIGVADAGGGDGPPGRRSGDAS